ncbi:thioredoxin family protein [Halarcobacter bivalviorum]|uniref:thioredoxin family protein n=1 Tax=Halarcobacter bivalviorum TaxID=663364 RepID=UPI00100BAA7E|nr:thioredoxin fold domain-containing protein [Halarcobacter bivalviorum]RXK07123.1 thioredoxin family protein [Halarcobacter bivalviorum]
MKVLSFLIIMVSFLFASGIDFEDSLKEAQAKAIKEKKPLMIMYSTPTCPECNYMKKKVFKNSEVSSYVNENFISVIMDIKEDEKELPYKFIGIPTLFFANAEDMKLLSKSLGGMREKEFLTLVKSVEK